MPISTIFTALFYPYIAQERTAQGAILSVRSERSALCLKERHRSQNEGLLKSKERLSDFKERYAQLCRSLILISSENRRLESCIRSQVYTFYLLRHINLRFYYCTGTYY